MSIKSIIDLIKSNTSFAIVSHTSPDGDCMGSMLGLYNSLIKLSKCVDVYLNDDIPNRLSFLPGADLINKDFGNKEYDIVFALDCGDVVRLGEYAKELLASGKKVINIDHHISNEMYGDINLVKPNMSSVGEMIYNLLEEGNFPINEEVAKCIYTAIISDTGGLKYSGTTADTFIIMSKLMSKDFDIDYSKIYTKLLHETTKEKVLATAKITSNLKTYFNDKVAILYVTKGIVDEFNVDENNLGDIVNIARDIDTVEIGIFLKEKSENTYKVSLRSKEYADVRKVAEKFGGGGHIKAAGCLIEGSLNEVIEKLLFEIKEQFI